MVNSWSAVFKGRNMAQKRSRIRSELAIDRLAYKPTTYVKKFEGRLYVRVTNSSKIWVYTYIEPGATKRRWISLGQYMAKGSDAVYMTAEEAKAKASEYDEKLAAGIDPATAPPPPPLPHQPADDNTLEGVYRLFLKKGLDRKGRPLRASTLKSYELAFESNVLPYLGTKPVDQIKRRDILPVLERISDRKAGSMANMVYRRLRRVLAFAAERELIGINPMAAMHPFGEVNQKDRVLTDEEIKTFWEWKPRSDTVRRILRLILLTGARPGEVVGMTRGEISGKWWTIPAGRSKTGAANKVYLTATALGIIPEAKSKKDGEAVNSLEPVFDISRHAINRCLARALDQEKAKTAKGTRGEQIIILPVEKFTPHDLRRTQATGLGALGFSDEVINAVQGRVKQGVVKIYNRHEYEKERQLAAEAWERKLLSIITGTAGNVLPLTKKRKGA